jgi:hypothetical protein
LDYDTTNGYDEQLSCPYSLHRQRKRRYALPHFCKSIRQPTYHKQKNSSRRDQQAQSSHAPYRQQAETNISSAKFDDSKPNVQRKHDFELQ